MPPLLAAAPLLVAPLAAGRTAPRGDGCRHHRGRSRVRGSCRGRGQRGTEEGLTAASPLQQPSQRPYRTPWHEETKAARDSTCAPHREQRWSARLCTLPGREAAAVAATPVVMPTLLSQPHDHCAPHAQHHEARLPGPRLWFRRRCCWRRDVLTCGRDGLGSKHPQQAGVTHGVASATMNGGEHHTYVGMPGSC